jgi:hypothetical protein
MIKPIVVLAALLIIFPASSFGEDFLGVPIIPGGDTVMKTEKRLEMKAPLSHDDVLRFYKEALRDHSDIKFRDWKEATYIEDDGKLRWHSITISKGSENETTVVIVRDNWTWIIGTLILRYIGVFVVLLFLFLGMSLSGNIISKTVKRSEAKKEEEKA